MRSTGFLQNEFMPAGSSGRNVTSKKQFATKRMTTLLTRFFIFFVLKWVPQLLKFLSIIMPLTGTTLS